jgi:hypothetical protein
MKYIINVWLPLALEGKLYRLGFKKRKSRSELITEILVEYFKNHD